MAKFKCKVYGSCEGLISKRIFHFDKGQVIDSVKGDFPTELAEEVVEPKVSKGSKKTKK